MWRFGVIAVVAMGVWGWGFTGRGDSPAQTTSRPLEAATKPLDAAMAKALGTTFEGFTWEKTALSKVLEEIQSKAPVNVVVDWRSLKLANVQADTPITLTARQVTMPELLTLISHTSEMNGDLCCHVVGGNIVITTEEQIEKAVVTRAYEVADLINAELAPAIAEAKAHAAAAATPGGGMFGGPGDVSPRDASEAKKSLMRVVATGVSRHSWTDVGSEPWAAAAANAQNSMDCFATKLVVRACESHQQKVAAFLEELRGKKGKK